MSQNQSNKEAHRQAKLVAGLDKHVLGHRALGILLLQFARSKKEVDQYVLAGAGNILIDGTEAMMDLINQLRGEPAND